MIFDLLILIGDLWFIGLFY